MGLGAKVASSVERSSVRKRLTRITAASVCKTRPYSKVDVPAFQVRGEVIAYASPDSTYAVTRRLFDQAKRSIRIGIYDFTAQYVKELLVRAMGRGVQVELLLDMAGEAERRVFDELRTLGCDGLRAPSCALKGASFFTVVHQKVIVIDDEWTLVQSGNYSNNSIPRNERDGGDSPFVPGNRDMGIAFRSKPLAAFFAKRLSGDRKLALKATVPMIHALAAAQGQVLFAKAPTKPPKSTFPSRSFQFEEGVRVQPVLTPDNYLPVVDGWLRTARKSVWIEQQYIWPWQEQVKKLVVAITAAKAQRPKLDVRVVLGKAFDPQDAEKLERAARDLAKAWGVPRLEHVRFIDQERFVHCHNKLVLIDGKEVLISSQNWSDTAVATNREAGVIVHDARIARYYGAIFSSDWETSVASPSKKEPTYFKPSSFATGKVVPVELGDWVKV